MATKKIAVSELKPGDKILPPERELRLWMRRDLAQRGLPESALVMTIEQVELARRDKRGDWWRITAHLSPEWYGDRPAYPWKIAARPETLWPVVTA